MFDLYSKAKDAWGGDIPKQLHALTDRSDESVFNALNEVLGDLFSDTWLKDSKIAWKLMQEYGGKIKCQPMC